MIKFAKHAVIDKETKKKLDECPVAERVAHWDRKVKAVKKFKDEIRNQGIVIQSSRCGWCMLKMGSKGRRTIHRDHIAPKHLHPEWTFLPINIVLACDFCNGFEVKGAKDTISTKSTTYKKCTFTIVHPYIDDPRKHLSFLKRKRGVEIVIQSKTPKGQRTITALKLDGEDMTSLRAQEYIFEKYAKSISPQWQQIFVKAVAGIGK